MSKEIAVLAGGCFWGMQDLIRKLDGVLQTKVGYCGGDQQSANYEMVKTGKTNHAESLWVEFDNSQISFAELLDFYFRIHDPTTKNRQGNDIGTQYRSVIFAQNEQQEILAQEFIKKFDDTKFWPNPILTTIEIQKEFFDAEKYHQDYLEKNPGGYTCHFMRR